MSEFQQSKRRHSKWRWFVLTVAGLCVIAVCVTARVWQRYHDVPEFYERATNRSVKDRRLARNRLKKSLEQMQQAATRSGSWNAKFDEQTINVWLAEQLPRRFFRLYRVGAREPVVAVEDGRLRAAVRYKKGHWDTIVSCDLEVEMTEAANVLAVRLVNLKAGSIPLPIEPFVRKISHEAKYGDVEIDWDFTDNGPVAMVSVPSRHEGYRVEPIVVESVLVRNNRLNLSGISGPRSTTAFRPRGSVHRFVSYQPLADDKADTCQPNPSSRTSIATRPSTEETKRLSGKTLSR